MTTYENEIRRRSWLSEETRRSLRHSLVLLGLIPLTVLLATRLNHLLGDPLLGIYAIVGLTATTTVMYLAFARYRDPSGAAAFGDDPPLVTCLVAVKNEADVIERCVRSLVGSSYPRLEVVVVDDGSTDGTLEQLGELRDELGFNLIAMPESAGKKRALTCGATTAHGDFLVFTDSDCVLAEDAIERAISALVADPELGAVSGHARALNADTSFLTKVQDTWYEGQFSVWKAAESFLGAVTCISGPLAAFRREAIFNYLPAWENDRFLGREFRFATDRQLTGYVLGGKFVGPKLKEKYADSPFVKDRDYPARNWKIGYVKSARVWTAVPPTLSKLVRQQVRWKKSFLRNLCFTGTFYWRKGPAPAFLFYSHAVFVLMTPLMAMRHLVYLPAHGEFLLAALYLIGVFFKGSVWALAYKVENPGCHRWVYRPFMSLIAALLFSPLLVYSALTLRKGVWSRG